MSKWAGKYVIGLTGNIGTGKSVVRRMLEHQGAYGIDADALAHRAIAKGAPGYQQVIDTFGKWVTAPDGQIDRQKIGRIVFSDPDALARLENIIHPLVGQAIDFLIRRSPHKVVVIEAIKLLEAGIGKSCDSIWVTTTPPEVQVERLVKIRKMSEADARRRITAQPPQSQKVSAANVVIDNGGTIADTWRQVSAAWKKHVPVPAAGAEVVSGQSAGPAAVKPQPAQEVKLEVVRGRPSHSAEVAGLVNRLIRPAVLKTADDIMNEFGEKAFMLLLAGRTPVGTLGWQVENLVSRITEVLIDPRIPVERALPPLMEAVEKASHDLQVEASLVFVKSELAKQENLWKSLGYVRSSPDKLNVLAWQEAAVESMPPGTVLFFKQLRQDRVLRPI